MKITRLTNMYVVLIVATIGIVFYAGRKVMTHNTFTLTSTFWQDGGTLPEAYTCRGKGISPQLQWANPPVNTKSFALVCFDPDAVQKPGWTHWVVFNIPATMTHVPEGLSTNAKLPDGTYQGFNSWGNPGYGGACPPKGTGSHRYIFTLYALSKDAHDLRLQSNTTREQLLDVMKDCTLGQAELIGMYEQS